MKLTKSNLAELAYQHTVSKERVTTIDVNDEQGNALCRIHIFNFGNGAGDVDVISPESNPKRLKPLAWLDGRPVLEPSSGVMQAEALEQVRVVGVDIRPREA